MDTVTITPAMAYAEGLRRALRSNGMSFSASVKLCLSGFSPAQQKALTSAPGSVIVKPSVVTPGVRVARSSTPGTGTRKATAGTHNPIVPTFAKPRSGNPDKKAAALTADAAGPRGSTAWWTAYRAATKAQRDAKGTK